MLQNTIRIFKPMLYFDIIVSVEFMPHCGEHWNENTLFLAMILSSNRLG